MVSGKDGRTMANGIPLDGGRHAGTPTVGIVGLGLIGGSLARRLVARGIGVVAWNHRPHPYAEAERDGIRCAATLGELVDAGPDLIVLCNPLKAMPGVLVGLRPLLASRPRITLTDVGSVKGMVRQQVEAAGLGDRYVGAHPMAGNEHSGWQAADPALYDGALWALTVTPGTDYARFLAVARFVTEGVGNRIIALDDTTHDQAAALISHMPHVVATALVNTLVADPDRNIAAALAAGSWRDMTRVALTDPERTRAMVEEDSRNVAALLRAMAARLTGVADALDAYDDRALTAFFALGQPFREYKARERAAALAGAERQPEERTLAIPAEGWQETLLASARHGERLVCLAGDHTAVVTAAGMD